MYCISSRSQLIPSLRTEADSERDILLRVRFSRLWPRLGSSGARPQPEDGNLIKTFEASLYFCGEYFPASTLIKLNPNWASTLSLSRHKGLSGLSDCLCICIIAAPGWQYWSLPGCRDSVMTLVITQTGLWLTHKWPPDNGLWWGAGGGSWLGRTLGIRAWLGPPVD